MARPKANQAPDGFTTSEMTIAAGIAQRDWDKVVRTGLAPAPARGSPGRSGASIYNQEAFRHTALIGAFHNAGMPLGGSVRLTAAIVEELPIRYHTLPSNLGGFCAGRSFPWNRAAQEKLGGSFQHGDDFWQHHLWIKSDTYIRGTKIRGDHFFEIVDREYVFMGVEGAPKYIPLLQDSKETDVESMFRIVGWENDAPVVRQIYEEFPKSSRERGAAGHEALKLENEFFAARDNAVSTLKINISLAIRNAFDALQDYRVARGDQFDWCATITPKLGRYDGVDSDGRPLDPSHPWNLNLTPARRKKRLADIEAYIDQRDRQQNLSVSGD